MRLFYSSGIPDENLLRVLEHMNVTHDGTMDGIHTATQDAWIQEGRFRAEIRDDANSAGKREVLMPLFGKLRMVDEVLAASSDEPMVCAILGAKKKAVEKRIRLLMKQLVRGFNCCETVLLGSKRDLFGDEIADLDIEEFDGEPIESAMMTHCFNRLVGDLPTLTVCADPPEGRKVNTGDTLEKWMEVANPDSDDILLVSSQPFVEYQQLVANRVLGDDFNVTVIGYAAIPAFGPAVFLDNIAKQIHEEWLAHNDL